MKAIKIIDNILFHYDTTEIDINNKEVKKEIKKAVIEGKQENINHYSIYKDVSQGIIIY